MSSPKIFTVKSRMIHEGRFDPEYHYALLNGNIKSPYQLVKLLSLAYFKTGGTPSTDNDDYWGGSLPWISAKDFKTFRFEDSEDHITELAAQDATTYVVDKPALLMVSRSGILQHSLPVMITYKRTAINQDIKAFFPDNRVSVDYLGAFFDLFGKNLLPLLCKSGATVQSINTNELMNLPIPVPPPDIQKQIVAALDAAYAAKRKADSKTAELLNSIDGVVLNALGIPPLPPPDTSLSARIFTVSSHDVTDRSFAPSHYLQKLDFSSARYECISFCETVSVDPLELVVNAKRPYHLVPMDAVSSEYGCIERVEEIPSGNMAGYSTFRNGDVIFAKISPCMENGKSAVVSTNVEGVIFGSTEFLVFRPNEEKIIADYLHLLLRLKALREYAGRNMSGTTGHQRVTGSFFRDLKIPVPPVPVQKEIVDNVSAIRAEAKTIKSEAVTNLAAAKSCIEKQLLT